MKEWRAGKASELQLDPGVLINNAMLETIARLNPKTVQALDEVKTIKNWQKKVLGQGLVSALNN